MGTPKAGGLNSLAAKATTHCLWVTAFPVNRWLIGRGLGHAKVMERHDHH